jgi:hypothetical protein
MPEYVVTHPYFDSNVGSNLSSLVGALWLAERLGRELVVDWRGLSQLRDPAANYFTEFFECPPEIGRVRIHYAPVEGSDYAEGSADAAWLSPAVAAAAGLHPQEKLPPFVVLQPYHGLDRLHPGPEAERFRLLRAAFRHVRPGARVAAAVDAFAAAELDDAALVVGVNVRTGNGHYFGQGMRYRDRVDVRLFDDGDAFLRLLARACDARARAALPSALQGAYRMFYATDSQAMSELLGRLPNAVTRRRVFPPAGEGDLYAFGEGAYDDRDSIVDTLADMFLLARCDALVWNFSLFNQYARVATGYFGGNHVRFESLTARARARRLVGGAVRRVRA